MNKYICTCKNLVEESINFFRVDFLDKVRKEFKSPPTNTRTHTQTQIQTPVPI